MAGYDNYSPSEVVLAKVRKALKVPDGEGVIQWAEKAAQRLAAETACTRRLGAQIVAMQDKVEALESVIEAKTQCIFTMSQAPIPSGKTMDEQRDLESFTRLCEWWDDVAEAAYPGEDVEGITDEALLSRITTLAYANKKIAETLECDPNRTIGSAIDIVNMLGEYERADNG